MESVSTQLNKRIGKALLDYFILAQLSKKGSASGYEVYISLKEKIGFTLSPGTFYSTLYSMQREDLLKTEQNNGGRVFSLTKNGEDMLTEVLNNLDKIPTCVRHLICKTNE